MVTVFWVLIYSILGLVIALVLILSAYLAVLIAERLYKARAMKKGVLEFDRIERAAAELFEETQTQKRELKKLQQHVAAYKETATRYEYEAHDAKKKQEETVERVLRRIRDYGFNDPTDDFAKGYNECASDIYKDIKMQFPEVIS